MPEDKFAISLKAEPIISFGGFDITNSMLTTLIVGVILSILVISALGRPKLVPGRWQAFWEFIVESQLNQSEGAMGRKSGRRLFPLLATFFVYILFANWFSLLPGIGSIGFYEPQVEVPLDATVPLNKPALNGSPYAYAQTNTLVKLVDDNGNELKDKILEAGTMVRFDPAKVTADKVAVQPVETKGHKATEPVEGQPEGYVALNQLTGAKVYRVLVPFLRAPNADLNMTLGMALISIILVQILAIRSHGLGGYIKEFFPKPYAFDIILTPVEIIGQLSRVLSLTFRLFGNVFAGEALLAIILRIAGPTLFIFIGLELFFGLIQALVFTGLSTAYMTIAVMGQEGGHGTNEHEPHHDSDSHMDMEANYPQQSEYVEKQAAGATR